MERTRQRRLAAIAAAVVLLGFGLGALIGLRGGDRDAGRTAREVVAGTASPDRFRGNDLPEGVAGRAAPSFELTDARGGRLSSLELAGKPYVLTFLYTDCPDVCPVIGQELRRTLALLGPRAEDVAVVAISVDPEGDTRRAVLRWLRRQHQPRAFHYLIGSRRDLRPVWRRYFVAPQPPGLEEGRHTASIWLVDARGRWRTKYSGGAPVDPRDVAHDLGLLLAES